MFYFYWLSKLSLYLNLKHSAFLSVKVRACKKVLYQAPSSKDVAKVKYSTSILFQSIQPQGLVVHPNEGHLYTAGSSINTLGYNQQYSLWECHHPLRSNYCSATNKCQVVSRLFLLSTLPARGIVCKDSPLLHMLQPVTITCYRFLFQVSPFHENEILSKLLGGVL